MKEQENKKFGTKKEIAIVNSVTGTRFLASFLVIPTFKVLGGVSAAVFSGIFLLTDFIDGFLARKFKASTFFGAAFDGATDKAYGIISFALLMTINPVIFAIPLLFEMAIVVAQNKKMKKGMNIKSNMIGKIKTWFLGLSIVGSFIAVDLLNLPPFIEYIKYASLDKVATIKESLLLLGIELPAIVFQLMTFNSYNKESKEELPIEEEKIVEDNLNKEDEVLEDNATIKLQEIANEKESLQEEMKLLEKMKALGNALFDPEYYDKNKDMPIRSLTKELFKKN